MPDELLYIVFFVIVLIGCYFITKWISVKSYTLIKSRNLRVIERIPLDKDKSIILLERGDKVYLLGVTSNGMSILDTLSKDDIVENKVNKESFITFDKIFRRYTDETANKNSSTEKSE